MMKSETIQLRNPNINDGARIWELVRDCKPLDLNSPYLYLLLCEHFSGTCLVAEQDEKLVGFVSAYKPPQKSDVVFVWQIATHSSVRNQGVGKLLLNELIKLPSCDQIKYVEATVSPSNKASTGLFRSLAKGLYVDCEEKGYIKRDHFPDDDNHEEEVLFRIGPLR